MGDIHQAIRQPLDGWASQCVVDWDLAGRSMGILSIDDGARCHLNREQRICIQNEMDGPLIGTCMAIARGAGYAAHYLEIGCLRAALAV